MTKSWRQLEPQGQKKDHLIGPTKIEVSLKMTLLHVARMEKNKRMFDHECAYKNLDVEHIIHCRILNTTQNVKTNFYRMDMCKFIIIVGRIEVDQ